VACALVQAQEEIFKVIQRDSFPSFLNSEQVGMEHGTHPIVKDKLIMQQDRQCLDEAWSDPRASLCAPLVTMSASGPTDPCWLRLVTCVAVPCVPGAGGGDPGDQLEVHSSPEQLPARAACNRTLCCIRIVQFVRDDVDDACVVGISTAPVEFSGRLDDGV
jgi:hypothetical protein